MQTRRDRFSTCEPQEALSAVADRNEKDRFDYLPVVQDDRIVGLLEMTVAAAAGDEELVRHRMEPLSEDNLIGADASILSFVRDADTHPCRLVISGRDITGLVSLSDLQRLPVRAALFAIVMHLEMTMISAIRRECGAGTDWLRRLPTDRQKKLAAEIAKALEADDLVDELLFTQLADKKTILKKTLDHSRTQFEHDMRRASKLRDHLAHANEYAGDRESAADVCRTVRAIADWVAKLEGHGA